MYCLPTLQHKKVKHTCILCRFSSKCDMLKHPYLLLTKLPCPPNILPIMNFTHMTLNKVCIYRKSCQMLYVQFFMTNLVMLLVILSCSFHIGNYRPVTLGANPAAVC